MLTKLLLLDELLDEETGRGRAIIFNRGQKIIGIIEKKTNDEWGLIPELALIVTGSANIVSVTAGLPADNDPLSAYYIFVAFDNAMIKCFKIAADQKSVWQIMGIKHQNDGQMVHHLIVKHGCFYFLENESLVVLKLSDLARTFTCPLVNNALSVQAAAQRKKWPKDYTDTVLAFSSFEDDTSIEFFFLIAGEIQRCKVEYSGGSMTYTEKASLKSASDFIDIILVPNTKIIIATTANALYIYNFKRLNPFCEEPHKVTKLPLAKPAKFVKAVLSDPDNPFGSNDFILKVIYDSGSIEHAQFHVSDDLTCTRSTQVYYKLPNFVQPDWVVLGVNQDCTEVILLSENTQGRPRPFSRSLARSSR